MTEIKVAETFYSIQGEGRTVGRPSVFIRLANCNLLCGGVGTLKDKQLHAGASWRCDTIETWMRGETFSTDSLVTLLERKGFLQLIDQKDAAIIITGGEPLLQQQSCLHFLRTLRLKLGKVPNCEIETNGTILPDDDLTFFVEIFNCSPKLANSGMPKEMRYNPKVLQELAQLEQPIIFKFVIAEPSDVTEAINDFIAPFNIRHQDVYLMPAASNRIQLQERGAMVADLAKQNGFNYSTRLQVEIWDEVVGV